MAYEDALVAVNGIHDGLAGLAREVVRAYKDGKLSGLEVAGLGMKGMAFASFLIMAFQSGNRDEILHVLEHANWVLAE